MRVNASSIEFHSPKGFLVFEGVNGAGKSTLMRKISHYLEQSKLRHILTREPGATKVGTEIRKILMNSEPGSLSPLAELFLFSADRAHHVETVIQPALTQNTIVLCDRYYYSTAAFQGYGRKLDPVCIEEICAHAIQGTQPDCVILLDLDPGVGLERTRKRSAETQNAERDSFEEEELEFHTRLREGFLEIADRYSENFFVLDASEEENSLFESTLPLIQKWIQALNV